MKLFRKRADGSWEEVGTLTGTITIVPSVQVAPPVKWSDLFQHFSDALAREVQRFYQDGIPTRYR